MKNAHWDFDRFPSSRSSDSSRHADISVLISLASDLAMIRKFRNAQGRWGVFKDLPDLIL